MANRQFQFHPGSSLALATYGRLVLLASLPLALACSISHGPEGADTNTSWLSACMDDDDCSGQARCLQHLCTLACTAADARGRSCQPLGARASCDTASEICDLPCDGDSECSALRAGLMCEAGRCREPGALGASTQTLELEATASDAKAWFVNDVQATWLGDRWRIAVQSARYIDMDIDVALEDGPAIFTSVRLNDVFPDGHLAHDVTENESVPLLLQGFRNRLVVGRDGRVAETGTVANRNKPANVPPTCQTRFYGPNSLAQLDVFEGECRYTPASVNASGDWVLIEESYESNDTILSALRYQPADHALGSPVELLRRNAVVGILQLVVDADERVGLYWRETSGLAGRASFAGSALLSAPFHEDPWRDASLWSLPQSVSGDLFAWTLAASEWLIPQAHGRVSADSAGRWRPVVARLGTESDAEPIPVPLELPLAEGQLRGAVHDLRPMPERKLLGYCHVEAPSAVEGPQTLWLHVFDEQGALQAAPVRIATSDNVIDTCRLRWSGDSFLVIWFERLNPRVDPGYPGRAFARIVALAPEVDASQRP